MKIIFAGCTKAKRETKESSPRLKNKKSGCKNIVKDRRKLIV